MNHSTNNLTNYLHELHAFRGFAILNIVGAHAWSFMIFWTGELANNGVDSLFWLTETIFHGSTLYFALISGLLFSKVLADRPWSNFFQSKLFNVFLPYVFMTAVFTALYWQYVIQAPEVNDTLLDYLQVVWVNVFNGKASIHFWYIPVLMVMFVLTPLLVLIQKRTLVLTWLIILLPLVISRSPFPDFIKPQSFVYFIGAYLLGMHIGSHYQRYKALIAKHTILLGTIAVLTSIALYSLYVFSYQPGEFYSVRQTLVYIQKLAISALVLYWFSKQAVNLPKWLNVLANYAFAIFFIHVVFIGYVIEAVREYAVTSRTPEVIAVLGLINFFVSIVASVIVAYVVKLCLGRHSRKLIGA
jgi:peptidoglycan/LPS O-acetylase OafA/YrhL